MLGLDAPVEMGEERVKYMMICAGGGSARWRAGALGCLMAFLQWAQVVNLREVEGLARSGVVFYGINISVGISVAIPGFGSDLAHGILGNLPFGAVSARSLYPRGSSSLFGCIDLLGDLVSALLHADKVTGRMPSSSSPPPRPCWQVSMVGFKTLEEARKAKLSGADSLLIKAEMLERYKEDLQQFSEQLRYLVSGDD